MGEVRALVLEANREDNIFLLNAIEESLVTMLVSRLESSHKYSRVGIYVDRHTVLFAQYQQG
jgi:hypothetical protein